MVADPPYQPDETLRADFAAWRRLLTLEESTEDFLHRQVPARLRDWIRAATSDCVEGLCLLADCHVLGVGVSADGRQAVRLYRQASEAPGGCPEADYSLGVLLMGLEDDVQDLPQDPTAGLAALERAARGGFTAAHAALGVIHHRGLGVEASPQTAYEHFTRGVQANDPTCLTYMALRHIEAAKAAEYTDDKHGDHGTCDHDTVDHDTRDDSPKLTKALDDHHPQTRPPSKSDPPPGQPSPHQVGKAQSAVAFEPDLAQAVRWLRQAAESGQGEALVILGTALDAGIGTPENPREAAACFAKAAEAGHGMGQLMLGQAYRYGRGLPTNARQAAHWFRQAAHSGETEALVRLGELYLEGVGVRPDPRKARELFAQAAEADEPEGHLLLAMMREHGRGGPRDLAAAVTGYRAAAEAGEAQAAYSLYCLYRDGKARPPAGEDPRDWLIAAAQAGHDDARDELDGRSPSDSDD